MPPITVVSFDVYQTSPAQSPVFRRISLLHNRNSIMTLFLDDLLTTQERVEQEYRILMKDFRSFYLMAGGPVNDNMYHWRATIRGPPGTPYKDGLFVLNIYFGGSYPLAPPRVCFRTKIFHPNICNGGAICSKKLLMLGHWRRQTRMTQVLRSIYELLIKPDIQSAMCPWVERGFPGQRAIAYMYVYQRELLENEARICTRNYAT